MGDSTYSGKKTGNDGKQTISSPNVIEMNGTRLGFFSSAPQNAHQKTILSSTPKKKSAHMESGYLDSQLEILKGTFPDQDKMDALANISTFFYNSQTSQRDTDDTLETIKKYIMDVPAGDSLKIQAITTIGSVFYSSAPKSANNVNLILPCLLEITSNSNKIYSNELKASAINSMQPMFYWNSPISEQQAKSILKQMHDIASNAEEGIPVRANAIFLLNTIFYYSSDCLPQNTIEENVGFVLPNLMKIAFESDSSYLRYAALEALGPVFFTGKAPAQDVAEFLSRATIVIENPTLGENERGTAIISVGFVFTAKSNDPNSPYQPYFPEQAAALVPALASIMKAPSLSEAVRARAVESIGYIFNRVKDKELSPDFHLQVPPLVDLIGDKTAGDYIRAQAIRAINNYVIANGNIPEVEPKNLVSLLLDITKNRDNGEIMRERSMETLYNIFKYWDAGEINSVLPVLTDMLNSEN